MFTRDASGAKGPRALKVLSAVCSLPLIKEYFPFILHLIFTRMILTFNDVAFKRHKPKRLVSQNIARIANAALRKCLDE